MKVYEAKTLIDSMEARSQSYNELREKLEQLKRKCNDVVNLDDSLKGKGADAIKGFYQAQIDVIEAWLRLIDRNVAFFNGVAGNAEDMDLSRDTVIHVPFLDDELAHHARNHKEMVSSQQDELQKIFNRIDDLVPLNVFSKNRFDEHMEKAEKDRKDTTEAVEQLDNDLKSEYILSEGDEQYVITLFQNLMEASRQGNTISPIHFNAEAYKVSDVYQMKDQAEQQTKEYLSFKDEQEKFREQLKRQEELENRPWYEKTWDGIKTFTGELTGYYDYIRASEGVDPVTGETLTAGQRVAAGAMAAAGFIPVVGWAGRIAKGGGAIYKTAKGMHAADQALDVYRSAKTFSNLEKAEMGIYGLVSANGFSEYLTGKDMFGNELTEEQQKNSLYQALGLLAVGGGAYYVSKLQRENAVYQVPKTRDILDTNTVVKQFAKEIEKHPNKILVNEVIRYVIKKQSSVNSNVLLDGDVVKKVLDEIGPKTNVIEVEDLKWKVMDETTTRNKTQLSPSQRARLWQGSKPYFGLDEYEDIIVKRGEILYAGYPFPTGYTFTKEVLDSVNGDAKKLFQGVQVNPRVYKDGTGDYRNQVLGFELMEDLHSARGITDANPQLGKGGLEQTFTPEFKELVREGKVKPILSEETMNMLREKGVEFDTKLLKQLDEHGGYSYRTICDIVETISDDPNVIKLNNFELDEKEITTIQAAVQEMADYGGGIK